MSATPVIAIFDIGRTNKKFMLFDQQYRMVHETAVNIPDILDEDGHPCEDHVSITLWMKEVLQAAAASSDFEIQAMNFSAHGASMVHIGLDGVPVAPIYDYLKPLDAKLTDAFYGQFGGRKAFSMQTGSPKLDMLNSGIQLFWLKHAKPTVFKKIKTSLHLPQYCHYVFTQQAYADITSVGCHTGLWDVGKKAYHDWLNNENVQMLLPSVASLDTSCQVSLWQKSIPVGIGLHDSSAALLPFVYTANAPFLLLSSGTWNITLNPYFSDILSAQDYERDCLYFLLNKDKPVAASRLFLGHECDHQVKRMQAFFHRQAEKHQPIHPDPSLLESALKKHSVQTTFFPETMTGTGPFPALQGPAPDLSLFASFEEAYHKLMLDMAYLQKISIQLLCKKEEVKRLYINGGFARNRLFMEVLQGFLPNWELFIAENKLGSAVGAALAIHEKWNRHPIPSTVASLLPFKPTLEWDAHRYQSFFEDSLLFY